MLECQEAKAPGCLKHLMQSQKREENITMSDCRLRLEAIVS